MPYLSEFKAMLFDVDRTINNSQKKITQNTIEALHAVPKEIYQGLCTGRIFAALDTYILPYFPPTSVHIIAGGAQLVKSNGEVIWEKVIPAEMSQPFCQQLLAAKVDFILSQDKKMYATPGWKEDLAKGDIPIHLADMTTLTHWETPLISIRRVTDESRQVIQQFPELNVKEMPNSTGTSYFDITAPGVNKSSALDKWSQLTGISLSQTIGFGDSTNDMEFLAKIGYPVAMGNAIPELKTLAKRVIGHTDQDGLAVYLRQISQGAEL